MNNDKSLTLFTLEAENASEYFSESIVTSAVPDDMQGNQGYVKLSKLNQAITYIAPEVLSLINPDTRNRFVLSITGGLEQYRQIKINFVDSTSGNPTKVIDVSCNENVALGEFTWSQQELSYGYDKLVIKSDADIEIAPLEIDKIVIQSDGKDYTFYDVTKIDADKGPEITLNSDNNEVLTFKIINFGGEVSVDNNQNIILTCTNFVNLDSRYGFLQDESGNITTAPYNSPTAKASFNDGVWKVGFMNANQHLFTAASFKVKLNIDD